MLQHNVNRESQSRRQVQRRFPPGSFVVSGRRASMGLVVGWGPTPSTLRPSILEPGRMIGRASSWVAYIIEGDRLVTLAWEFVRSYYTLEEWESLETGP